MAVDYLKQNIGMFVAGEDLSGHQWRVVELNSLNPGIIVWQKPSLLGSGIAFGVLRNEPGIGQEATVQISGVAKIEIGGSNPILASRSVGYLPDGTISEGGNLGISLAGGIPGDIIEVLLRPSPETGDNFSYELTQLADKVIVPVGQQMSVHGGLLCVDGPINIDGTVYIEE